MSVIDSHLSGYGFELIAEVNPVTNDDGYIVEYAHALPPCVRPNRYASGPFCRFLIPQVPARLGNARTCQPDLDQTAMVILPRGTATVTANLRTARSIL